MWKKASHKCRWLQDCSLFNNQRDRGKLRIYCIYCKIASPYFASIAVANTTSFNYQQSYRQQAPATSYHYSQQQQQQHGHNATPGYPPRSGSVSGWGQGQQTSGPYFGRSASISGLPQGPPSSGFPHYSSQHSLNSVFERDEPRSGPPKDYNSIISRQLMRSANDPTYASINDSDFRDRRGTYMQYIIIVAFCTFCFYYQIFVCCNVLFFQLQTTLLWLYVYTFMYSA